MSTVDKAKEAVEDAVDKAKEAVGKLIGDHHTETEVKNSDSDSPDPETEMNITSDVIVPEAYG
jgi:hypothetical protein